MEPSPLERRLALAFVKMFYVRGRRGGPWEVPEALRHERLAIPSFAGATLDARWFPHPRPRGTVLLAHPDRRYGKHWFVREGWVEFLHAHRYEVMTFDFPGYGETPGTPAFPGEHVVRAARAARAWSGGLPLHVMGVSFGAFAAAVASPRLDFADSLVLESPYPSFEAWYGKGPGKWLMGAFQAALPGARPHLHADAQLARAAPARILVALAEEDDVTPPALSEAVARAAPDGRARLVRVPGARHLEPFGKSEAYRDAILRTLEGA